MYNVAVNGTAAASESSYEKAVTAAKAAATDAANALLRAASNVLNSNKLYRSPKARTNVARALSRQAINLAANAKFPKKSGNVSVRAGGVIIIINKA